MILVSHPIGNACVRALLTGLERRGLLAQYVTALGFNRGDEWIRRLPLSLRRQFERRWYDLAPHVMTRQPLRESVRLVAIATGARRITRHERGWASVDAVFHAMDELAARTLDTRSDVAAVYAYEDGAERLFASAKARGLVRCYELPMGYWREAQTLFQQEADLQPDWATTLGGLDDSAAKLERKEHELALASAVIVASSFSRQSLSAFSGNLDIPISVIPHGAPPAVSVAELQQRLAVRPAGALRVLFVGGLSQRKGLSYLFAAMDRVGRAATLTVVGRRDGTNDCQALNKALSRHRHIESLPRAQLLDLMRQHDILVLPSLFEGFGLVLLEAMAQGLPVISTPHTAAPDLFNSRDAGVIVSIRSAEEIAAAVELIAADSGLRETMALNARAIAEQHSWNECSDRLAAICLDRLNEATRTTPRRA